VLWASVASRKGAATTTRLQFLDRAHTHSHSWAETCTCLNCCWRRSRDLKIIWKHRNKLHTHTHTHARTQVQSKVSESESLKIKWQQQQLQRRQPALEIVTNQISARIFICFALIFCFTITPKSAIRHKCNKNKTTKARTNKINIQINQQQQQQQLKQQLNESIS